MVLAAGTLVTKNVRLVELLGVGGMGSVWVADHLTLGNRVAVKFILETAKQDAQRVARFRREATIAAKMKSPHAVQIFDHGVMTDGTPYIVMERLEGESLSARLARGPLSLGQTKLLVSQVTEVLNAAHELGITHRDLKPDNLFLMKSGYELFVKVLDFGIAKQLDGHTGMTSPGAMMGTPMYMSPEQIESAQDATHHADLWALAVVAYHALVGSAPFQGETVGALCIAISKAKFEPVTSIRPALPLALDAWFSRALQRDPAKRFQSAQALSDALKSVTTGAVSRLEAGAHSRTWRPRVASLLVVLAAGSAAVVAYASRTPAQATLQPSLPIASLRAALPARSAPVNSVTESRTASSPAAATAAASARVKSHESPPVESRSRPPPSTPAEPSAATLHMCRYLVGNQVELRPCQPRMCKYLDGNIVKERPCAAD